MISDEELHRLYVEDLRTPIKIGDEVRAKYRKWSMFDRLGRFLIEANDRLDLTNLEEGRTAWIWSDQHFHHKNIIRYSERPFRDLDEMHYEMFKNHNSRVKEEDVVIWLGDVGFASDRTLNEMLSMFNGYKILIMGNHDVNHERFRELEFDEIHVSYQIEFPEVRLCLTHYPMKNLPKPLVNVHGHEHKGGTYYSDAVQHYNVNCEFHEYAPVRLDLVREIAADKATKMRKINEQADSET